MSDDMSNEALDALVSRFRAGACEPDERCRDMRASSGCHCAHAADAITALRAQIEALTARATAAEAALAAAMEDVEAHKMALQVAMRMLSPYMPGDSRAVPDEFVACAAVECGLDDGDGRVFDCLKAALEPNPAAQDRDSAPATLTYRNWRGEVSDRVIIPRRVWFGSTEWHPEPQWLLTAWDVEKNAERDFALCDFLGKPGDREALIAATLERDKFGRPVNPAQPQTDALAAVRREARVEVWEEVLLWMRGIANPTLAQSSQAMARNYVERIAAILTAAEREAGHD